ncbi:MAG: SRPBCC family protein [Blastocatellia bacterium]
MAWEFQYAVDCPVSRAFAWQFWSNVENWLSDPSVESLTIDGPFAAGTRGATKTRGGETINWHLIEVEDDHRAVIEIGLPGAVVRFHWQFEDVADAATRLTQRVTLEGERAADYLAGTAELEKGIPAGMQRLAAEIASAAQKE